MAKKKIENDLTDQFPPATFEGADVEKVAKDEKFMEAMKNDAEINEGESHKNSSLDKPFEGTSLGGGITGLTVNGNKLQQSVPTYQAPPIGTHIDLEGIELHAYESILVKYEFILNELTELYKSYPTPRVQLQTVLIKDLIKTMKESIRYDIV